MRVFTKQEQEIREKASELMTLIEQKRVANSITIKFLINEMLPIAHGTYINWRAGAIVPGNEDLKYLEYTHQFLIDVEDNNELLPPLTERRGKPEIWPKFIEDLKRIRSKNGTNK